MKWSEVEKYLPGRNMKQCSYRYNRILNNNSKWTQIENHKLFELVNDYGEDFDKISYFFPKKDKSNIINQYYKKIRPLFSYFTHEEDETIINQYRNSLSLSITFLEIILSKGSFIVRKRLSTLLKLKNEKIDESRMKILFYQSQVNERGKVSKSLFSSKTNEKSEVSFSDENGNSIINSNFIKNNKNEMDYNKDLLNKSYIPCNTNSTLSNTCSESYFISNFKNNPAADSDFSLFHETSNIFLANKRGYEIDYESQKQGNRECLRKKSSSSNETSKLFQHTDYIYNMNLINKSIDENSESDIFNVNLYRHVMERSQIESEVKLKKDEISECLFLNCQNNRQTELETLVINLEELSDIININNENNTRNLFLTSKQSIISQNCCLKSEVKSEISNRIDLTIKIIQKYKQRLNQNKY